MQITNISKEDLIDILKQIYRCIPESFPKEKKRNWSDIEYGLRKLINFFEENAKLTESNDLYKGDTKIFDTAELNLMADKIIKRFGDIKDFEEFYSKAFEYADGYISESAFADEYGVDEEDIEENYYDYIDAFVETIYDSISK